MTYAQIHARQWDGKTTTAELEASLGPCDLVAWRALRVLTARVGFLDWWSGVDDEIKNEVFTQLKRVHADSVTPMSKRP